MIVIGGTVGVSYGAEEATIKQLKEKLIVANQILDYLKLAAPFGHVSVRIPGTETFLISRNCAPGMVANEDDILVCDKDGKVIQGKYPRTYSEVPIHAAPFKKRKDVNAVVHSHTPYVIALSMAEIPVLLANLDGLNVGPGPLALYKKMVYVDTPEVGEEICDLLGPNKAVILKGHGALVVGRSLEEALYTAKDLETAAMLQWMASAVGKLVPMTDKEKAPVLEFLRTTASTGGGVTRWWSYYEFMLKK